MNPSPARNSVPMSTLANLIAEAASATKETRAHHERLAAASRAATLAYEADRSRLVEMLKGMREAGRDQEEEYLFAASMLDDEALIEVDCQNDFVHRDGSLYVREGEYGIEKINALRASRKWAKVVVTKDAHSAKHCSFQVNNPGSVLFQEFTLPTGVKQVAWPEHCVVGSWGSMIHSDIVVEPTDWVVHKGEDDTKEAYSAFEGRTLIDGVSSGNLADCLRASGINRVIICGYATDYCVRATALDAVARGFTVKVVLGACRGVSEETSAKAIAEMRAANIIIE